MLFVNQRLKIRPPVLGSRSGDVGFMAEKATLLWIFHECFSFPYQVSFEHQLHSYQSSYHRRYIVSMLTESLYCQRKIAIIWRYFEVMSVILEVDEDYTEVIGSAIKEDYTTPNIYYL